MSVAAPSLFNVDGLVALVTGGGTGKDHPAPSLMQRAAFHPRDMH